jgi:hypothetical protein
MKKVHDKNESLIACGFCSSSTVPDGGFRACSRCKLVHYCNKQCQTAHWKEIGGHKQFCIALADRKPGSQAESSVPKADIPEEEAPLMCSYCSSESPPKGGFKICSQCKSARYCSTECQTFHWKKGHSKLCVAPNAHDSYSKPKSLIQECVICLEKIPSFKKCSLPCEHVFHAECIANLRLSSSAQACPLCRGDLPPGPQFSFLRGCTTRDTIEDAFRNSKGRLGWHNLPKYLQDLADEMVQMWTYAASEGDVQAQYNMGMIYSNGQGVKRDLRKALEMEMYVPW